MTTFPIFLSVVLVVRNRANGIKDLLTEVSALISELVSDHELIIVDNSSQDDTVARMKELTAVEGLPNLQVYALTKEVDWDTACWVGLENALGDFVAVADPLVDDINFLSTMLDQALAGADVVFAENRKKPAQSVAYRIFHSAFHRLYKWFSGIHLAKEAPAFRVLSRRVVNFILQHRMPSVTYRHLPATGGFSKANLVYRSKPRSSPKRRLHLVDSVERGMRLLVSTTQAPMRAVTSLSLFGAVSNLLYSGYVIAIAIWKTDVAPGWVTLSLQQSGMFFLISLVLLVLGEYILQMASLSNEGPIYNVAQEFTSAVITRREKLNVEIAHGSEQASPIKATSEPVA